MKEGGNGVQGGKMRGEGGREVRKNELCGSERTCCSAVTIGAMRERDSSIRLFRPSHEPSSTPIVKLATSEATRVCASS